MSAVHVVAVFVFTGLVLDAGACGSVVVLALAARAGWAARR
jgi:hypothetical protein